MASMNVDWDYGEKYKFKKKKKEKPLDPYKTSGQSQPHFRDNGISVYSGQRKRQIEAFIGRKLKECRGVGKSGNCSPIIKWQSKNQHWDEFSGGLTLKKAAELIGIPHQSLSYYEKGLKTIPADMLYKIATVYNKPIDWFFNGLPLEMEIFKTEVQRRENELRSRELEIWFKNLPLDAKERLYDIREPLKT